MSMKIIHPGFLTTIQDLGRYGFQKYGVSVSGAMDPISLRIANLLVGNEEGEGAFEMTLMGPSLTVERDMMIAITGGDLLPTIDENKVPMWRPVLMKKGSTLKFNACKMGCRAYLAVAGGFRVSKVMNSKSTFERGAFGGYHGRKLQNGDILEVNEISEQVKTIMERVGRESAGSLFFPMPWYVQPELFFSFKKHAPVRVMRGDHFDQLTISSQSNFFKHAFSISSRSDRMGYRLSGPKISLKKPIELLSEAVSLGTIQLPPDGNPIMLLADRQTTGGYPRIAHVATVDIPVAAQRMPGEKMYFKEITYEQAQKLYIEREQRLEELKIGIHFKLQEG
jgi:antagonist of KipI